MVQDLDSRVGAWSVLTRELPGFCGKARKWYKVPGGSKEGLLPGDVEAMCRQPSSRRIGETQGSIAIPIT